MQNIPEIDELVKLISKLPGLGPKSAKRIVLKLINNREELIKPIVKTLESSCANFNNTDIKTAQNEAIKANIIALKFLDINIF